MIFTKYLRYDIKLKKNKKLLVLLYINRNDRSLFQETNGAIWIGSKKYDH